MERSEFLKLFGSGAVLVCAGCLDSCSKKSDPAPNVDFTLPENSALQNPGGSLAKNGVIIARISTAEFTALSRACTHEGTAVNYQSSQQNFLCPNHLSKFDKNGSVLNGPASSPLRKYNTELTGTSLRVF
jgi:Rieske Fe-S protein